MYYSILIFGAEGNYDALSPADQEAAMEQHRKLQSSLSTSGALGPVVKLLKTSTAVTVREKDGAPVVMDGPFAETKEQLLGFYVVECSSIEEAIEAAKKLPLGIASMEVRPIEWFDSGVVSGSDDD
jgi:hypothetical protein